MKPAQALAQLLRDMQVDRAGYARLRELLEAQFQAALRHATQALVGLADDITRLVAELEERRATRSRLLAQLLGPAEAEPTLARLLQRLPASAGQTLTVAWQGLEQQIRECKQMNLRNCRLITEQHALMQRVLGVEEQGYAQR
ncbi:MAG: flagellar protein FlgN [Methylibium sp.]|nr:flagellar protein FlgN [Methylibium sp.]